MTTTAQSIIKDAQVLLSDEAGVRWPATDLVNYLNDGQREIAVYRPEMFVTSAPLVLVAGAKQPLPTALVDLIDIPRLTDGGAMRQVGRDVLDAIDPDWYTGTPTAALKHYCYDAKTPQLVYVYPPAVAGSSVELIYSVLPAEVAAPGGAAWSTVTGNINCDDIFKNALLHFVMYRALAKDAEVGNADLSAAHYQLFKTSIGSDVAASNLVAPK